MTIAPRLSPRTASAPAHHGGWAASAPGLIDFSSNLNPFGPPPPVLAALQGCSVDRYPDPASSAPRAAAARVWQIDLEQIGFVAGASEAIHRIARAYLTHGDSAVIAAPAFGEYHRATRMSGGSIIEVRAQAAGDPALDAVAEAAEKHEARLVFIASPSSPFGHAYPEAELRHLADAVPGLLVLDESYCSFATLDFAVPTLQGHSRVVHIRSITKDFALAGVRAALVCGDPDILEAIDAGGPPWSASALAQCAATAALCQESLSWLRESLARLRAETNRLRAALLGLELQVAPTTTNYLTIRVADAARLQRALRFCGVEVRDCSSFGLPHHVRIGVRSAEDNAILIRAFERVLCSI